MVATRSLKANARVLLANPAAAALALLLACCGTSKLIAQNVRWETPPETITVDFSGKHATEHSPIFTDLGMAYEQTVAFAFLNRSRVSLQAKLPEAGRFVVVFAEENVFVKLEPQGNGNVVQVSGKFETKSEDDLRKTATQKTRETLRTERTSADKEARQKKKGDLESFLRKRGETGLPDDVEKLRAMFVDYRSVELGMKTMRGELAELATKHPEWASKTEQEQWPTASDAELFKAWLRILMLELAHEHLEKYGIHVDANRKSSDNAIQSKFMGLYGITSGKTQRPKEPPKDNKSKDKEKEFERAVVEFEAIQQGLRALGADELNQIRKQITAKLKCRYYPPTDEADPNSQWFNGQRVAATARGVAALRIEGELNPEQHDRVDWWTIVGFDSRTVSLDFAKSANCKHELFEDKGNARLRVTATGKQAAAYAFELKPTSAVAGQHLLIRENRSPPELTKFPF